MERVGVLQEALEAPYPPQGSPICPERTTVGHIQCGVLTGSMKIATVYRNAIISTCTNFSRRTEIPRSILRSDLSFQEQENIGAVFTLHANPFVCLIEFITVFGML